MSVSIMKVFQIFIKALQSEITVHKYSINVELALYNRHCTLFDVQTEMIIIMCRHFHIEVIILSTNEMEHSYDLNLYYISQAVAATLTRR